MKNSSLYIKELHKSFEVRHSNKNMKLSYKFQLEMARMGQIGQNDDYESQFKFAQDYSQSLVDFPAEILKLNDKQKAVLDDMDQLDLQKLDVRLALTVQGLSQREINGAVADMDKEVTPSNHQKSRK